MATYYILYTIPYSWADHAQIMAASSRRLVMSQCAIIITNDQMSIFMAILFYSLPAGWSFLNK